MTDLFSTIQQVPYTAPAQAPAQTSVQVKEAVSTQQVPVEDKVEISTKQKEKKGLIKAVKGFIAGVKKFFASTGEYAKGTAKGLVSGAMLGSFVYTVGDIANKVKKKSGKLIYDTWAVCVPCA